MMFMKIEKTIIQQRNGVFIVFDMIVDVKSNEKLSSTALELFLRGRKLNISLVFILSQCYFKVPKTIELNATHYFIMDNSKKIELQQIASKSFI